MDEILKKLLESDFLSDETKTQLSEQLKTLVQTYLSDERSKLEIEVRASLTEEFITAREELSETVNQLIDSRLTTEINELKDDINKFRDLEVEYAEKLIEEKEKIASELGVQINGLVDNLDSFLEVRLDEELTELKDDIEEVKKLEFGRKIFEAMETEFKKFRKTDLSEVESQLEETLDKLNDAETKLAEIETKRLDESRTMKLNDLLGPLSGNSREQMKIILSNVKTEKLEEAYNIYISRILKESVIEKKETLPLTSQLTEEKQETKVSRFVSGNEAEVVKSSDDQLSRLQVLAGVK